MPTLTYDNYTQIPYEEYYTLEEKMQALFHEEVLLVKKLDRHTAQSMLVKLDRKKYDVAHVASDVNNPEWVLQNVGLNDLSLSCVFRYDEELFAHKNKYMKNDVVQFIGADRNGDAVIIENVFESNTYPGRYAYTLSGAYMLYAEDEFMELE